MRKIISLTLGLCVTTAALATQIMSGDTLQFKENAPEKYTVQEGDTLWDISSMYLHSPWRWPDIWSYNDYIDNPHLIYPGDTLYLNCSEIKQCQVVTNRTPESPATDGSDSNMSNEYPVVNQTTNSNNNSIVSVKNSNPNSAYVRDDGTIVLSPKPVMIKKGNAIETIPREHIEFFLNRNQVVSPTDLENKPHIIASQDGRLILGGGDNIYAVGTFDSSTSKYMVYREGEIHKDPITKEVLGLEIRSLGLAYYNEIHDNVHALTLQNTEFNVRVGDYLYPVVNEYIEPFYTPRAPNNDVAASILSVSRGVSAIGQYDAVLLSKGERDGLEVGHILTIVQNGGTAIDPKTRIKYNLPNVTAGSAMIFSIDDKTSYALILEAFKPIKIEDLAITPK